MGNPELEKIIKDFLIYFNAKNFNIKFNFQKVPEVTLNGSKKVQGLRNLVSQVSGPVDPELDVIIDQWVEYALIYFDNINNSNYPQILKDLNDYITDKVYFVGVRLGPIDVLLYYLLYNVVMNLTLQEKEKYLHFSRWFNFIQQDDKVRLWRNIVPFSRSLLYQH